MGILDFLSGLGGVGDLVTKGTSAMSGISNAFDQIGNKFSNLYENNYPFRLGVNMMQNSGNPDMGSGLLQSALMAFPEMKKKKKNEDQKTPLPQQQIDKPWYMKPQGFDISEQAQQQPMISEQNQFPATNKETMMQQVKDAAMEAYPDNPVMQQVSIAQAILESGLNGKPSQLAQKYNNLFGIKAPGTAGTVNMSTNEFINGNNQTVKAGFGANKTMGDSFRQHRGLMGNKRYAPVMASQNPYDAFNALENSGYATDPQYAEKLAQIFGKYVAPLFQG